MVIELVLLDDTDAVVEVRLLVVTELEETDVVVVVSDVEELLVWEVVVNVVDVSSLAGNAGRSQFRRLWYGQPAIMTLCVKLSG